MLKYVTFFVATITTKTNFEGRYLLPAFLNKEIHFPFCRHNRLNKNVDLLPIFAHTCGSCSVKSLGFPA